MPMPVVFTSTLDLDGGGEAGAAGEGGGEAIGGGEELVYSISQTPQVWLDHQVGERAGELSFNWDAVEELFPPGLLDEMFAAYLARLARLAAGDEGWREGWRASALAVLGAADLAGRAAVNATAAPLARRAPARAVARPRRRARRPAGGDRRRAHPRPTASWSAARPAGRASCGGAAPAPGAWSRW